MGTWTTWTMQVASNSSLLVSKMSWCLMQTTKPPLWRCHLLLIISRMSLSNLVRSWELKTKGEETMVRSSSHLEQIKEAQERILARDRRQDLVPAQKLSRERRWPGWQVVSAQLLAKISDKLNSKLLTQEQRQATWRASRRISVSQAPSQQREMELQAIKRVRDL